MEENELALRAAIVRACLEMSRQGLNQGTSGNVSVRWNSGLLITPSGLPYESMAPEDIVFLDMEGSATGRHAPSSEWRFHRDILRERPELNAVVHAHPPYATAQAILNEDVPAVHYMIAAAGGSTLRCAPYATFGTGELSAHALAALRGRTACLLANHGLIACGTSLPKALWLAAECEILCRQYAIARQSGRPVILSDADIAAVLEKFASYGPRDSSGT